MPSVTSGIPIPEHLWPRWTTQELESQLSDLAALAANENERQRFSERSALINEIVAKLESTYTEPSVRFQCLRVLGNVCADNNLNRNLVMSVPGFVDALDSCWSGPDEKLRNTAIIVAFNFCNDYDVAQSFLVKARNDVLGLLVSMLANIHDEATAAYVLRLMEFLILNEAFTENKLRPDALPVILRAIPASEVADNIILISTLLTFESFRLQTLKNNYADLILLCEKYELLIDTEDVDALKVILGDFSNISGMDVFSAESIPESLVELWERWISLYDNRAQTSYLRVAGLTFIGNLCTNETACVYMVNSRNTHISAISIIKNSNSTANEMYSAAGLLKNLAISDKNKRTLVQSDVFSAIGRLLECDESPQVIFSALGLLRVVLSNSYENAHDFVSTDYKNVFLTKAVQLHSQHSEKSIRLETSRLFCTLIRSLSLKSDQDLDLVTTIAPENTETKLTTVLSMILSLLNEEQHRRILSSEALFSLALVARDSKAAAAVAEILDNSSDLSGKVREIFTSTEFDDKVKDNAKTLMLVVGQAATEGGNAYKIYKELARDV
ncbi:armadillo-type protein [Myxozyma melibiosi]|uniref:Armadillo-type protein n=1 Tax=Myxozyma melibiosi TaxID=54550 RepID=A0ABR1F2U8_9ASCO